MNAKKGTVEITNKAVEQIASRVIADVSNASKPSCGLLSNVMKLFTHEDSNIKVKMDGDQVYLNVCLYLDVCLSVQYGVKIPDIARQVQYKVKEVVEKMTGLVVASVNVYVRGLIFPEEMKSEKPNHTHSKKH
ncbi:Asp23/Gls24 family envelope stress response protein [Peptococcaceae bacterium]|nr:Asp23/Gls24 family envelope stress response protein [Peptococcaceae bacterium]MCL0052482.1 Asp23/Gls24 family envelope stress response protein [Peptococcaceae bacterium]